MEPDFVRAETSTRGTTILNECSTRMKQRNVDTDVFLLGANFGFSYCALASLQSHAEDTSVEVSFYGFSTRRHGKNLRRNKRICSLAMKSLLVCCRSSPRISRCGKSQNASPLSANAVTVAWFCERPILTPHRCGYCAFSRVLARFARAAMPLIILAAG